MDGAEFANSFIEHLLRIIQHMAPGQQDGDRQEKPPKLALLREQLPFLAISDKKLEEEKVKAKKSETAVDNMMEFLEIMVLS